jgi:probable F420-dependent oxidoreductase
MTTPLGELGRYGLWRGAAQVDPALAKRIEAVGFRSVWLGGSPDAAALADVAGLLEATERLVVATGIVNVWQTTAEDAAAAYHRLERDFPGRFLLGIGIGHPEAVKQYRKPYESLVDYLDVLDDQGVPVEHRALAALGPRVLRLARDRTRGAHPYLTPPEHTRVAREELGPDALLAPEHKVVFEADATAARAIGRPKVDRPYLHLVNYVSNLKRLGWTDADIADGGSDALIDALVAWGTPETIVAQLDQHLDAGADHVTIQILGPEERFQADLETLAGALDLSS